GAAGSVGPAPDETAEIVPGAPPSVSRIAPPQPQQQPDATPPPDAPPPVSLFVPEIGQVRAKPPSPTACGGGDDTPMLPEPKPSKPKVGETPGGLDKSVLFETEDRPRLGA